MFLDFLNFGIKVINLVNCEIMDEFLYHIEDSSFHFFVMHAFLAFPDAFNEV